MSWEGNHGWIKIPEWIKPEYCVSFICVCVSVCVCVREREREWGREREREWERPMLWRQHYIWGAPLLPRQAEDGLASHTVEQSRKPTQLVEQYLPLSPAPGLRETPHYLPVSLSAPVTPQQTLTHQRAVTLNYCSIPQHCFTARYRE